MQKLPIQSSKIHFIGILGIGMSALAQFLNKLGYIVTGSDRDYGEISQKGLIECLGRQGIKVYPQDGSAIDEETKLLVYSTAIEEDNIDFVKGAGVGKMHRSNALSEAINMINLPQIAIAGSSGKTSVTALLATSLQRLGKDVLMINGGVVKDFVNDDNYGNFKYGKDIIVFEADESDGSLVHYNPNIAVLLNLSKDHYSELELAKLFKIFLNKAKDMVFLQKDWQKLFPLGQFFDVVKDWGYEKDLLCFETSQQKYCLNQLGYHSVLNSLAVIKILNYLGYEENKILSDVLAKFSGVKRRFDYKGKTANQSLIYDDYAHNVAKICTSLRTMQEKTNKLMVVFQPHGYRPLNFMQEELGMMLAENLLPTTKFYFLPVFYVGGTSLFSPTSDEVVKGYQDSGLNVQLGLRQQLAKVIAKLEGYTILIMGARDDSLSLWTESLVK